MGIGKIIIGIIFSLAFIFFLILLFDAVRLRILRKRYKEEKDLSKHGEKRRRSGIFEVTREGRFDGERKLSLKGFDKFKRSGILPTTNINDGGEKTPIIDGDKDSDRGINKIDLLLNKFKNR